MRPVAVSHGGGGLVRFRELTSFIEAALACDVISGPQQTKEKRIQPPSDRPWRVQHDHGEVEGLDTALYHIDSSRQESRNKKLYYKVE